ncbi:MAG: hypothetical protein AB7V43_13690 [Acidimicrobiia bacterium]
MTATPDHRSTSRWNLPRPLRRYGVALAAAMATLATVMVAVAIPAGARRPAAISLATPPRSVAIAVKANGTGLWVARSDGRVVTRGTAVSFGDLAGKSLNAPIRQVILTPSENGYWLMAADGGIFSFGDARFYGSMGGKRLNAPIVSMAATPSGQGYWLVGSDGGVFSFGDARFYGSTGGQRLNQPVNGITASPTGRGYRFVASDGGVFSFGDAAFFGSSVSAASASGIVASTTSVVAMAPAPGNNGYWTAHSDGQIDSFGSARALGGGVAGRQITALGASRQVHGYAIVSDSGEVQVFGALDPALAGPEVGPSGTRCYLGLHGWGYFGEGGVPGFTGTNIQPDGNIDLGYWPNYKRNAHMWLYYDDQFDYPRSSYPQASYEGAMAVVNDAVSRQSCGQIVVQGFSNGAGFAAKMYCRGETFGGRVVGYIIDDPVTDRGVEGCAPAPGVQIRLFHSDDLMRTAGAGGPCRPDLTWFCDGNWRYTAAQYDALIGASNVGPFKPGHYPSKNEYAAIMNNWWK